MRSHPYPVPPSRVWTIDMVATYGALALAGGLVLFVVATNDQPIHDDLVLALWGGLTTPGAAMCMWGVARNRYRWEWVGAWLLVMGTSIYLVVATMGVITAGPAVLLTSAPTLLFFVYGLGRTLGRAIVLSLIDLEARHRVVATRTGEIPEVPVNE